MEVSFKTEHQGMFLVEPIKFSPGINLLCGKNGSGKTRLIDAIRNQHITSVTNENGEIQQGSILFMSAKNMLSIQSGRVLSQQHLDDIYRAIISTYRQYVAEKEKNPQVSLDREVSHEPRGGFGFRLDRKSFSKFIRSVSESCNKDIDSLTEADIKSEKIPSPPSLNIENEMSALCSSYLWLKKENEYRKYLKEKGKDVFTYDFESKHGREPWLIINDILMNDLDLDWYLDQKYDLYEDVSPVKFKSKLNDSEINIQHLSDGEKTILWITCALIKHTLNRSSLEGCQLILLDEPDAFLHPKMIHCFLSVIKKMSKELGCDVIMSTHSPTTVALAKECNVYNVTPNSVKVVSQDQAIKDLLDGVNYIAVSPENRRTVYVEGYVDRLLYEILFTCCRENNLISSDLTVQFIEAAPRTDQGYLLDKIRQNWKGASEAEIIKLADEINGQGSCSSVRGQVSAFRSKDDSTVYGIIDRDKKNKSGKGLIVLCDNSFYAIDNVALNPVAVLFFLFQEYSQEILFKDVFDGLGYNLIDLITSVDNLSKAIIVLCNHVFPQDACNFVEVEFIDGNVYNISKIWIDSNGHELEVKLKEKFSFLASQKFNREGKLKEHIVKLMCEVYKAKTYPSSLLITFNSIK